MATVTKTQTISLFRNLYRELGHHISQKSGPASLRAKLVQQFQRARSISGSDALQLYELGQSELHLLRMVREKGRLLEENKWGVEGDQKLRVERSAAHVGLALPGLIRDTENESAATTEKSA